MFALGPIELFTFVLIGAISVVPFWRIFAKAGYPGPLALTVLVPVLNVGVLFYLAFATWPIERRLLAQQRLAE